MVLIEVQLTPLKKWFEVVDESNGLSDDCCILKSHLERQKKKQQLKKKKVFEYDSEIE